jgi:hypothetical protein
MIEQENERLKLKMMKNGSFLDTHNNYVLHRYINVYVCLFRIVLICLSSLNTEQRQRQQAQHDSEVQRLQKQISQVRPSYPAREYQQDYAKKQDVKKRMTKFPSKDK